MSRDDKFRSHSKNLRIMTWLMCSHKKKPRDQRDAETRFVLSFHKFISPRKTNKLHS